MFPNNPYLRVFNIFMWITYSNNNLQLGTNSFGASGHYTCHLSSKSHARIAGRIGRLMF